MQDVLQLLIARAPQPAETGDLDTWWGWHKALAARFEHPADLALAGGFFADRLAWAFASGYQAAGLAAFPGTDRAQPLALAATEAGGAHPRAIQTTLRGGRLNGNKTFVTLGGFATRVAVIASEGTAEDGRNRLRVCLLAAESPGLRWSVGPGVPFAPEIPHALLELDGVAVEDGAVLPGDGYSRYLKPFRTIEDSHVHAAALGHLLQLARRAARDPHVVRSLIVQAAAARALAACHPSAPATHVALDAAWRELTATVDRLGDSWEALDLETRRRFERDRPLLRVAAKARVRRLEVALAALGQPGGFADPDPAYS